jgi:hypothetical protein
LRSTAKPMREESSKSPRRCRRSASIGHGGEWHLDPGNQHGCPSAPLDAWQTRPRWIGSSGDGCGVSTLGVRRGSVDGRRPDDEPCDRRRGRRGDSVGRVRPQALELGSNTQEGCGTPEGSICRLLGWPRASAAPRTCWPRCCLAVSFPLCSDEGGREVAAVRSRRLRSDLGRTSANVLCGTAARELSALSAPGVTGRVHRVASRRPCCVSAD